MKKIFFSFFATILSFSFLFAQTWDGSASTDWNTAANWSTNAVPTSTGTVIIPVPGIITNWPVLANDITIGHLTMNTGSQLNTAGFNITITLTSTSGGCDITGAIVTNPVAANTTAISVAGGGTNLNGSTFNGNFHFITTSANQTTSEAATAANTWNGNTTFTLLAGEALNLSVGFPSVFNGDLTVNKPVDATDVASANLFWVGGTITGNFTLNYDDNARLWVGNPGFTIRVGGQLNMNVNNVASSLQIYGLKNYTTGGTIVINNVDVGFTMSQDSLLANTINITQTAGSTTLDSNYIEGTFTYSQTGPSSSETMAIRNTIFDGDASITSVANAIADGNVQRCYYLGNASFSTTTGSITLSNSDTSWFYKNLTVNSATGLNIRGAKFVGNSNSEFTQTGTQAVSIGRIIMEKTGGAGLTLNDPVAITTAVRFTSGNIYTSAVNYLRFNNTISHTGASAASHVVGTVQKLGGLAALAPFTFPTGTAISYNPITKSNSATASDLYSATYVLQNPTTDGYNTSSKAGTLNNIGGAGYWNVQRLVGTANVTITLGFATNPYEQYPLTISDLKVAHWNGSQWDDKGMTAPTGDNTLGSITNSVGLTAYGPFALANMTSTYLYDYSNPGTGPDGTPVKIKGVGGWPGYQTKQLPAGVYSADSVYLVPNATSADFKLRDIYNVEKDDTTITAPVAPSVYISANGNGTKNFAGWRHFVYLTNGSNEIIGAIKDNDLTLGNTTMTAYFSTTDVATAPNGTMYLKRSFKITSEFSPVGTKRVRFYISKTEFNNLLAADPASFPNGINSLTITKYTGSQEDSLFNPIPGGNASIIPNNVITIADLGTMYSLDIDVTGFSGFYIGGNQSNLNICNGSNIAISSDISGTTYQWQVDDGSGYTNISDGGVYSGTATNTLTLSNVPGSTYGYKLRAVVNGSLLSQVYTLQFKASWLGTANNVWENPANWSCGQLPDGNTDVIITGGKPNYPVINASTSIRTLTVNSGVTATVNPGATLTILK